MTEDTEPMQPGSCSTTTTRSVVLRVRGSVVRRDVAVAGRVYVDVVSGWNLRTARRAEGREPGVHIAPLPGLGPGAFIVTRLDGRTEPSGDAGGSEGVGTRPEFGGAAPGVALPARAFWARGRLLFTASASREGATPTEAQRITARLAGLVNRFPAKTDGGGVVLATPRPAETGRTP